MSSALHYQPEQHDITAAVEQSHLLTGYVPIGSVHLNTITLPCTSAPYFSAIASTSLRSSNEKLKQVSSKHQNSELRKSLLTISTVSGCSMIFRNISFAPHFCSRRLEI
jgi:hypothetical protein